MKFDLSKSGSLARSISALTLLTAVAAHAETTIEEILVTAQRRAESVQDVPVAVSAFSGEFMRERNLNDVKDLAIFTPGVTGNSQDSFIDTLQVRGILTNDFGVGGDPSIGFFKNNIYQGRNGAVVTSLYDIQRAEVLRGPQGFLFGRNAIGGAVSVFTNRPPLRRPGRLCGTRRGRERTRSAGRRHQPARQRHLCLENRGLSLGRGRLRRKQVQLEPGRPHQSRQRRHPRVGPGARGHDRREPDGRIRRSQPVRIDVPRHRERRELGSTAGCVRALRSGGRQTRCRLRHGAGRARRLGDSEPRASDRARSRLGHTDLPDRLQGSHLFLRRRLRRHPASHQ
ncbi:MAG: TonB-dependent receptor [Gammaproteobacteria bacterium]|nr:TonB-dependent receptor [Gammaproteobacteria bacterium]